MDVEPSVASTQHLASNEEARLEDREVAVIPTRGRGEDKVNLLPATDCSVEGWEGPGSFRSFTTKETAATVETALSQESETTSTPTESGVSSYPGVPSAPELHRDGKVDPTTAAFSVAVYEEEAGQSSRQDGGVEKEKAKGDMACHHTESDQCQETEIQREVERQLRYQSAPSIQQRETTDVEDKKAVQLGYDGLPSRYQSASSIHQQEVTDAEDEKTVELGGDGLLSSKQDEELNHAEGPNSQNYQLACRDTYDKEQDENNAMNMMRKQLASQDISSSQQEEDRVSTETAKKQLGFVGAPSSQEGNDRQMKEKEETSLAYQDSKTSQQPDMMLDDNVEKQLKYQATPTIPKNQKEEKEIKGRTNQHLECAGVSSSQLDEGLDAKGRACSRRNHLPCHDNKSHQQEEDKEVKGKAKQQLGCVGVSISQQHDDREIKEKAKRRLVSVGMPKIEQPGQNERSCDQNEQLDCEEANSSHQSVDELLKTIAMHQYLSTSSDSGGLTPEDDDVDLDVPPAASLPGAYSGLPGAGHTRRTKVDFSLVGMDSSGELSALSSGDHDCEADCLELTTGMKESGDINDNGTNVVDMPNREEFAFEQTQSFTEPPSSHLTVASLVLEASDKDRWPRAEEVDSTETLQRRKDRSALSYDVSRAVVVLVGVLLFLAGAVLLIVFLLTGNSDETMTGANSEGATSSSQSESFSAETYLMPLLPEHTVDTLEDPDSPQSKAFQWVLQDPSFVKYTDARRLQRFALASFYYSTNGPLWTHNEGWLSYEVHECEWSFASMDQYLVELYLVYTPELRNITRQSPTFPCELVSGQDRIYTHLWQYGNNLVGQVPEEIYLLTNIRNIAMGSEDLAGSTLSTRIGTLTSLASLTLTKVGLTGTLPTELGLLSSDLKVLMLGSNELTGTIPMELGLLSSATDIDLAQNNLAGTIPTELGLLTNANSLWLFINKLTGTVPTDFGRMTDLGVLMLSVNQLTGTMPAEVCHMEALRLLYLNYNALTGNLPSQVGKLSALREFGLDYNGFTGALPSEIGLLSTMVALHVDQNNFNGIIPADLGALATNGSLMALHLKGNNFSGAIPSPLCDVGKEGECPVQPVSDCSISFDCSADLCGCGCSC